MIHYLWANFQVAPLEHSFFFKVLKLIIHFIMYFISLLQRKAEADQEKQVKLKPFKLTELKVVTSL